MIDLRSDTVTRPGAEMRATMAGAEVGDDVYGEDPTVNRLETMTAQLLGKEAGLFVCSGTQSNLTGLLSHCERGDEYIVGQQAHTYKYEGGGAAVLGSIQPQPLEFEEDGTIDLDKVRRAVKPDDSHFARTRLLCLENTVHGKVLPLDYQARARDLTRRLGLGLHLDGARLFNAAVKLQIAPEGIAGHYDSVSVCLSKGLGAPVGSVLCGSRDLIARARRWRKVLGGGMRQAGLLAAAGIWALQNNIARLAEDHHNALSLAQGLTELDGIEVQLEKVQTNMVFIRLRVGHTEDFVRHMGRRGVLISAGDPIRLVTHLDVSAADVQSTIAAAATFFKEAVATKTGTAS
jgi:threonine aldolase